MRHEFLPGLAFATEHIDGKVLIVYYNDNLGQQGPLFTTPMGDGKGVARLFHPHEVAPVIEDYLAYLALRSLGEEPEDPILV